MKTTLKALIVSALMMTAVPFYASAANFSGEYAGDCGGNGKYQCALSIEQHGKTAKATLTVANRTDFAKVKCKVYGVLRSSGKSLDGDLGKFMPNAHVSRTVGGGVNLDFVNARGKACGVVVDGDYTPIGE